MVWHLAGGVIEEAVGPLLLRSIRRPTATRLVRRVVAVAFLALCGACGGTDDSAYSEPTIEQRIADLCPTNGELPTKGRFFDVTETAESRNFDGQSYDYEDPQGRLRTALIGGPWDERLRCRW